MDLHKPKPWHGLREFLKEYLIIVVGVLTALGAEAVVQNLHDARLSAEARDAVRSELNVNITNLSRRLTEEGCVGRRLDEIAALLDRADDGAPFVAPRNISGPQNGIFYTQRWQAATAGGRTSLLSSDEQRAFGRVYAQLELLEADKETERRGWRRLGALQGLRRLSPQAIYDQRLALADVRFLDNAFQRNLREAAYYAGLVGAKGDARLTLKPGSVIDFTRADICQPLDSAPDLPSEAAHGRP
jgi:hypothetical protein